MPDTAKTIVMNTSPTLALIAALGDLKILRELYTEVWIPQEVCKEIAAGGPSGFGLVAFNEATWLKKQTQPVTPNPMLANSLDLGEAAVIQLALDRNIPTVCIDEAVGRRIARLSGLQLTGSIGILLRAKREGHPVTLKDSIQRMLGQGIRLSQAVIDIALKQSGES